MIFLIYLLIWAFITILVMLPIMLVWMVLAAAVSLPLLILSTPWLWVPAALIAARIAIEFIPRRLRGLPAKMEPQA